jgi:NAD(P)H-nitrite reductase large subunit
MEKQTYTENVLDAPDSEIVCWCSRVTKGTILAAKRQGATNLGEIRTATSACTVGDCKRQSPRGRCCSREIIKLLEAANKKECSQ